MRVAIVAPPFIPVPPVEYGGTELFIDDLARGLHALGVEVIVYTNGESTVGVGETMVVRKIAVADQGR
jgi:hypothetical protein